MLTLTKVDVESKEYEPESPVKRFAMLWGLDEAAQSKQVLAVIEVVYPYNCFVDESIQDQRYNVKVTGVSAYLATFENWLKFEQEWRGILDHYQVPLDGKKGHDLPFMHMTDFIARKMQFKNDWPDSKRNEFIERLTMTISEHTILGVSVSVFDEEFEQALPPDAKGFWREPYFFCAWGMLTSFMGLDERFLGMALPYPMWFLFDPRPKAKQFATQLFYSVKSINDYPERFGGIGFGEMWQTTQIQAADILVYESVRRRVELRNNPNAVERPSFQRLRRKNKLLLIELGKESLDKYVEFVRLAGTKEEDG